MRRAGKRALSDKNFFLSERKTFVRERKTVKIIVSVIVTVIKTRMDGADKQARDKLEPQSNIVV